MKKVGKYIIITLLLLLGLCCVGGLYLFFVPNSSLFNITYINLHSLQKTAKFSTHNISSIEVNSRSYDVVVLPHSEDEIYLEVKSSSFGFVLKQNKHTKITYKIKNNVLIFDVTEPHGFAIKNDSEVRLYLPKKQAFNLKLSNKDAQTEITNKDIYLNDFTYSTNSGDLLLKKLSINGKLNLNLNKSKCELDSSVVTKSNEAETSNNVDLSLTTGKFYAKNSILRNIIIKNNNRGTIILGECADIDEFKPSAGGQIVAKKVMHINVDASDTIININEKAQHANINLTGSGKVYIAELEGDSRITTNSGNITVNKCKSNLTAYTDEGNITIKKAYKTIATKTQYGNIDVSFSEDAEHYSKTAEYPSRVLHAILHNGKLTAKGVEHIGFNNSIVSKDSEASSGIVVTGNGRVHLEMSDVCGDNNIVGKNGSVYVVVNHLSVYKLTTNPTTPTKGNVRVNLMQVSNYFGYRTKSEVITYVNSTSSSYNNNTLTVSTEKGDLTLLDTKLC